MFIAAVQPFAGHAVLDFLRARVIPGVERVGATTYERVHAGRVLRVDVRPEGLALDGADEDALARIRALFDVDAPAPAIDAHLARDPRLRALVRRTPGLRVPGAWDPFELGVRTVLGQQVSVAAATTLAARFAARFGAPHGAPHRVQGFDDARAFPTPHAIAAADVEDVARIGVPRTRAATIVTLARALADGAVVLAPPSASDDVAQDLEHGVMRALVALPGIGPWTAKYLVMRGMGARDVFLAEDLVVRKALASPAHGAPVPVRDAAARAARWAPWRSTAVLHLWRDAADPR